MERPSSAHLDDSWLEIEFFPEVFQSFKKHIGLLSTLLSGCGQVDLGIQRNPMMLTLSGMNRPLSTLYINIAYEGNCSWQWLKTPVNELKSEFQIKNIPLVCLLSFCRLPSLRSNSAIALRLAVFQNTIRVRAVLTPSDPLCSRVIDRIIQVSEIIDAITPAPVEPLWRRRHTLSISTGDSLQLVIKQLDMSNDAVFGLTADQTNHATEGTAKESVGRLYIVDSQPYGDSTQVNPSRANFKRGWNYPNINQDEVLCTVVKNYKDAEKKGKFRVLSPFDSIAVKDAGLRRGELPTFLMALPVNVLKPLSDCSVQLNSHLTMTIRDSSANHPIIALIGPNAVNEQFQMAQKALMPGHLFKSKIEKAPWQIEVQISSYSPKLYEQDVLIGAKNPFGLVHLEANMEGMPEELLVASDIEPDDVHLEANDLPEPVLSSVASQLAPVAGMHSSQRSQNLSRRSEAIRGPFPSGSIDRSSVNVATGGGPGTSMINAADMNIEDNFFAAPSEPIVLPSQQQSRRPSVAGSRWTDTGSNGQRMSFSNGDLFTRDDRSAVPTSSHPTDNNIQSTVVEDPFLKLLHLQQNQDCDENNEDADPWDQNLAGLDGFEGGHNLYDESSSTQHYYKPPVIVGDQRVDSNTEWENGMNFF